MDRVYPFIPTDRARTFNVVAQRDYFDATLYLEWGTDREDAQPIAEQWPKSHRVKASSLSSPEGRCGTVRITVDLTPNASKGAANETGEARVRNFLKTARKLGYRFEVQIRNYNRIAGGSYVRVSDDLQIREAERFLGNVPFVAFHPEAA